MGKENLTKKQPDYGFGDFVDDYEDSSDEDNQLPNIADLQGLNSMGNNPNGIYAVLQQMAAWQQMQGQG